MTETTRHRRVLVGGAAAAAAAVLGFAGATASAEPLLPQPPAPGVPVQPQSVPAAPITAASAPVALGTAGEVPAARVPEAVIPATTGTIHEYLAEQGVRLEPQSANGFRALSIVLPMPRGWSHVPDPNVPDAFAVIADRVGGDGLYSSNAQLVVYRLIGDFDPREAIRHGFVDALQLPVWNTTDQSMADFYGMPSSLIEGTYRDSSLMLNTSRRHVIADTGTERYLVSLAVNTSVEQAVAAAEATDAIVNGFRVSVPGRPAPTAPAPADPAVAAPASPASPLVTPVTAPATAPLISP
ncbi:LpqN/LpqT family lipoprotein [uncultured Mycolicibacterium sp.]|uniref:LpqN/LpqT family lipoprotein n=1 Tax=uncultured Mycolicibacterium sp. TaxID=2320817 RepID=UPI00261B9F1E|nr:LpqN/LpqT family lipoprotein [uncultured Mycolicibacterium sp.]